VRTSHRPEDAQAFFAPLRAIAARQQCLLLCCTHTNVLGEPLGRRIQGQGRVVLSLSEPDPVGQPKRRKLEVIKSNALKPRALGVTMGDNGNTYDLTPPEAPPKEDDGGDRESCLEADTDWLADFLADGSKLLTEIRKAAKKDGISSPRLYRARDQLPIRDSKP